MGYKENFEAEDIQELFEGILKLESIEECGKFFEDLCTIKEINAMAQRLEVAKMLNDNKKYTEIEKKTGASTATISRIARFLNYGAGGYKIILERLEKK